MYGKGILLIMYWMKRKVSYFFNKIWKESENLLFFHQRSKNCPSEIILPFLSHSDREGEMDQWEHGPSLWQLNGPFQISLGHLAISMGHFTMLCVCVFNHCLGHRLALG